MIELNLLEKKQPIRLPVVLGVDFNDLNFKMLGVAFFIYYIPDIFIHSYFESQLNSEQEIVNQLSDQHVELKKEIGKNANVKSQLDAYSKQVEKLKSRSTQVDEILKIRTNPRKVLEKIARSIPDDLWIDSLKISENRDIVIQGGAYAPRSIGEFITVINDSPFFANNITPTRQENKQEPFDGVVTNYESFELRGKVKNYELRSR